MKTIICIFSLITATALFADDIKTLSGMTFKNVTITRIEANGITIGYDTGVTKLPFSDLPEDVRTKYGYDPKKAAAFTEVEQATAAQRNAANLARQQAEERNQENYRQKLAGTESERSPQQTSSPAPGQAPQQQPVTLEQMQQIVDLWIKLQQMTNARDQQTNAQDQQYLDYIQQLQALKAVRGRPRVKQTPAEANAWWQQYQQQEKLQQMQSEIDRLRQQQRR